MTIAPAARDGGINGFGVWHRSCRWTGVADRADAAPNVAHLSWGSQLNPFDCPDDGYRYLEVNVTGQVVNDADQAPDDDYWARLEYNRHIQVWKIGVQPPSSGERYCVLVKYQGSWTTIAGDSPNNTGNDPGRHRRNVPGGLSRRRDRCPERDRQRQAPRPSPDGGPRLVRAAARERGAGRLDRPVLPLLRFDHAPLVGMDLPWWPQQHVRPRVRPPQQSRLPRQQRRHQGLTRDGGGRHRPPPPFGTFTTLCGSGHE